MLNRISLGASLTIAALAVAAPTASAAKPYVDGDLTVCNEAAWVSQGGTYEALDGDPFPHPARFQVDIHAHRGKGVGLVNAATQSPALALCASFDDDGNGGGGDNGGGGAT